MSVKFVRAESGGYLSVLAQEVEVAIIGRGFSVTVWEDKPEGAPIYHLDGRSFRSLVSVQQAILAAFAVQS